MLKSENWIEGVMVTIKVDDDVKEMIANSKEDYRICTACMGPALVPVSVKGPKSSDIQIKIGERTLYVSAVQARYVDRISMDMIYDDDDIDSCPAFPPRRRTMD